MASTLRYECVSFGCRGLIIKNVTVDDGGSYKCKATQSGYGITDFRDLVIHLKIERELQIARTTEHKVCQLKIIIFRQAPVASRGSGQVLRVHLRREQPDVRGAGGAGGGVHVDGQVQRGRQGGHCPQRGAQERPHGELRR